MARVFFHSVLEVSHVARVFFHSVLVIQLPAFQNEPVQIVVGVEDLMSRMATKLSPFKLGFCSKTNLSGGLHYYNRGLFFSTLRGVSA